MSQLRLFARLAAALALVACAPASWAMPIQWTLSDVLFEDGGTASGSFIYDASTNAYSAISITTSGGSLTPNATFTALVSGTSGDAVLVPTAGPNLTGSNLLQLIFQFPLTNAGGTVYLYDPFFPAASSYQGSCLNAACTSQDFGRLVVDGGIISGAPAVVPVPAALWMFGAGLGVLGIVRRRQR